MAQNTVLVGQNVSFDEGFSNRLLQRAGRKNRRGLSQDRYCIFSVALLLEHIVGRTESRQTLHLLRCNKAPTHRRQPTLLPVEQCT